MGVVDVDVMVMEDTSMLVCGRGQSAHKLTETKKNITIKNEYIKQTTLQQ